MKGLKTIYICSNCEYVSPKWLGKCPKCNSWNTLVEDVEEVAPASSAQKRTSSLYSGDSKAQTFESLESPTYIRSATGLSELDRVLGGGLVSGSAVLI